MTTPVPTALRILIKNCLTESFDSDMDVSSANDIRFMILHLAEKYNIVSGLVKH